MTLSSEKNPQDYYSLGLSATPQTYGFSEILVPALGPIIYTYGFSQAIKNNVINLCVLYNIGLFFTNEESEKYDKITFIIKKLLAQSKKFTKKLLKENNLDFFVQIKILVNDPNPEVSGWAIQLLGLIYRRRSLVCEANVRVDCANILISRLAPGTKIIIFGERIKQCDLLYSQLVEAYPNQVARYHSKMGPIAKKNSIARFREGEVRILVCCKALDEGFDIPSADVGIVLSSTSTERQRIQRLGRILRRTGTKTLSSLYYFFMVGTIEYSGLLPEAIDDIEEFGLYFHEAEKRFIHPDYDQLAYKVVDNLSKKKLAPENLSATEYFLGLGQVRSDWLLDDTVLNEKLKNSPAGAEHNYWLCMSWLSREKERKRQSNPTLKG
jgi:superfamily II DNA or RNA helicase